MFARTHPLIAYKITCKPGGVKMDHINKMSNTEKLMFEVFSDLTKNTIVHNF